MKTLFKIFISYLLFSNILNAFEPVNNINFELKTDCLINSFINNDKLFIGVGLIFDDETLENKACFIKYDISNKQLIQEKSFPNIHSFYKIIPYNDEYFLLGTKLLAEEYNIGRSYADRGFTGLLLKLNKDFDIKKEIEIELSGFGNVKDFQIDNNKIVVLIAIKNSTIYDEKLFATLFLKTFDTNLILLENLELKTNDYLATNFYIDEDKYIIINSYHNNICLFKKNGYMEKCLNSNENNKIVETEKLKSFYIKEFEVTAFDFNSKYTLTQKNNLNKESDQNNVYLYKIGE